jgi:hypothetical protein
MLEDDTVAWQTGTRGCVLRPLTYLNLLDDSQLLGGSRHDVLARPPTIFGTQHGLCHNPVRLTVGAGGAPSPLCFLTGPGWLQGNQTSQASSLFHRHLIQDRCRPPSAVFGSQVPSTRLSSPPTADSWPFKFASGGACTYAKPHKHAQRLQLLGRPVCGMVGIQFGWECSPTTFGSITTSYLVHGKRPFTKCLPDCRSRWASW